MKEYKVKPHLSIYGAEIRAADGRQSGDVRIDIHSASGTAIMHVAFVESFAYTVPKTWLMLGRKTMVSNEGKWKDG